MLGSIRPICHHVCFHILHRMGGISWCVFNILDFRGVFSRLVMYWTLNWNSQCVFWQSVVRNMCFTTYLQNVHRAAPIAQNALFCSAFHLEDSFFKTYGHHGTNGWGRWSPTTQKHIRRIMRSGIAGPCEQIAQNRCSAALNVLYQPLQILLIARNDDSLPPCDYVLVAVCLCNVIFWKPGISITIEYTL